jgi:hypothetical protein
MLRMFGCRGAKGALLFCCQRTDRSLTVRQCGLLMPFPLAGKFFTAGSCPVVRVPPAFRVVPPKAAALAVAGLLFPVAFAVRIGNIIVSYVPIHCKHYKSLCVYVL